MLVGIFHEGSGLGNQLHRYVATRCIALDKGYEFGMFNPELFKGASFMNLDMGVRIPQTLMAEYDLNLFNEHRVNNEAGIDIRDYDSSIGLIKDNTLIDGEFQDERYWKNHEQEVRQWLKVDPLTMPDDLCVIAFRGGEYTYFSDLFLSQRYWDHAIEHMKKINPEMRFRVVTDDVTTARLFFPDLQITHEIGHDWRSIRYAHYLILSNSSFGILPAWLNENVKKIIAPKWWARHNVSDGYWAMKQNRYQCWSYQDREGNLSYED